MDKRTGYPDDWPLEPDRKFDSEFFVEEELTAKQQENDWLRNRDAEDGVYTKYPTSDYCYTYYECLSIEELRKAFLRGNWAIRQCFTYRNLAFINQMNGGDEWWTLKKFEDGRLLRFESITMIRTINHEVWTWAEDFNTSEYKDHDGWCKFRVVRPHVAKEHAATLTKKYHEEHPEYINPKARFEVGAPTDPKMDVGIYFVDVAQDYFPEYIAQMLKASYDQCQRTEYTDEEFNEKYRSEFRDLRVKDARELQERVTE